MQKSPGADAPWFPCMGPRPIAMGPQIPKFTHLKSVPPPPLSVELPSPRLQLPFSSQQQQNFGPHRGHGRGGSNKRGRGDHANRGFNNFRGRGRHQQHRGPGRSQNQQITSPLPGVVKPTCDTCDKAFPDDAKLAEHLALHQVCGLEGCEFSAHPKIVAAHVEMQHRTGLYKQLVIGADPIEISKWREERKNRFPTRANIELKHQALKEKIVRGERISAPSRPFSHRGQANWNKRPDFNRFNCNKQETPGKQEEEKKTTVEVKSVKPVTMALPRVLAGLANNYASSSESDCDDAPLEISISRGVSPDCEISEPPAKKVNGERVPPRRQQQQKSVRQQYIARQRPPTLLQKLLQSEMRHERNVILQCVRHIVNNNFLQ